MELHDASRWVWKGTIPSLNGLRALAIIAVIASHYNRDFAGSWVIGHFGVTSFFVLSGFLITLLLLRERERSGTISLLGFYQRRALRILPAYLAFLGVMAVLNSLGILQVSALTWITALTYTSCFFTMIINPHIAHSWSLSVEEHFYFLWPLLFGRARPKTTISILIGFIALNPLLRYVLYRLQIPALDIDYASPGQMGSIATGCLIAFLVTGKFWPRANILLKRVPYAAIATGLTIIVLSVVAFRSHKTLHHVLMDPVRLAAFGLAMVGILYLNPGQLLPRFLNWAPMNGIGILSYSLYLWQQVFARDYRVMPGGIPGSLVFLLAAAGMSYGLIESPFLKWKDKLSTGKLRRHDPPGVPGQGLVQQAVH